MIYKGNKKVLKLYKGSVPIIKRYKGTQLIFDSTASDDEETIVIDPNSVISGNNFDVVFGSAGYFWFRNMECGNTSTITNLVSISGAANENVVTTIDESLFNQINEWYCGGTITQINKLPNINYPYIYSFFKNLTQDSINLSNITMDCSCYGTYTMIFNDSYLPTYMTDITIDNINFINGKPSGKLFNLSGCYVTNFSMKNLDLSECTYIYNLFNQCNYLETADLTGWDASHITSYSDVFYGCKSLSKLILGETTQENYDWWYARLTDAGIQNQVTIEYTIV